MGSLNHQSKFACSLHCELISILIVTLVRTSYYTADASLRNVTNDHFLNVSYQQSPKLIDVNNVTSSLISPPRTRSDDFHKVSNTQKTSPQQPNQTTTFDLVLKDESTQKFKRLQKDESSKHSYNSSNMNPTSSEDLSADKEDVMMTSDSRNYYRAPEEEYVSATEDESFNGGDPSNESYDEASSTLSEQKVVKEITKLISKGMAGATDQMKLDTLENWKRRQKERKVIKDNRAKVFEDILTAAINSHSEKLKKEVKKKKPENKRSNPSPTQSPLFSEADTANLDPELARDAETVVKQLQNVASLMENDPSLDAESSSSEEGDGSANRDSSDSNETSSSTEGESKTTKKPSTDRPIVRQFKKIKMQISQRRKQLDQIKKIFNVDLSINPKDGSLVGKSTPKKKETAVAQDFGDFTVIDENPFLVDPKLQKRTRKPSKNTKMNDLVLYLKENPDIMASVMSELTTDADPRLTHPSVLHAEGGDDTTYDAPIFNNDMMTRKIMGGFQRPPQDIERILLDRARKSTRNIDRLNLDMNDPLASVLKYSRSHNYDSQPNHLDRRINTTSMFPLVFPKSPESRLLETLRERQLLNLMKLDMVLAERHQAGSNRSHVVSRPNEPLSYTHKTVDKIETNSNQQNQESKLHEQRQSTQRNNFNTAGSNNGLSDEEIVHHYMVTNGDLHSPESRNQNNWKVSSQKQLSNQPTKTYDDATSSYPAQYQTDQSTGYKDLYDNRHTQRQQPLDRFNNWLDVSRSEASLSNRNDKNMQTNLSWTPYDLTTGGSSSIQHRGTSAPETNSSPRFYQKPITQFKENELPVLAGINHGNHNHHIKDYGDSIVIQPDHFLTSGSRIPHDELNPNNSIFMTRSSVSHKVTGTSTSTSTGTDSDTEKDMGYDQNSRISREDKDDTSVDEDNSEDLESKSDSDFESPRGAGPVDYFSAYKRQDHLLDAKGIQYRPALKKRRSVTRRVGSKDDALGGMWA